ncbi:hypothetical protein B0H17DRAFT_1223932 [Mycena rosella]|uniref:Uncharacterized protein n=1 Tax=Mycena rosella TaxID=1033263 RepID=A0AAD7MCS1_MYCRO|nr:hypothetical protein B0H17DRAFT_1223932 [Mycena rosella]
MMLSVYYCTPLFHHDPDLAAHPRQTFYFVASPQAKAPGPDVYPSWSSAQRVAEGIPRGRAVCFKSYNACLPSWHADCDAGKHDHPANPRRSSPSKPPPPSPVPRPSQGPPEPSTPTKSWSIQSISQTPTTPTAVQSPAPTRLSTPLSPMPPPRSPAPPPAATPLDPFEARLEAVHALHYTSSSTTTTIYTKPAISQAAKDGTPQSNSGSQPSTSGKSAPAPASPTAPCHFLRNKSADDSAATAPESVPHPKSADTSLSGPHHKSDVPPKFAPHPSSTDASPSRPCRKSDVAGSATSPSKLQDDLEVEGACTPKEKFGPLPCAARRRPHQTGVHPHMTVLAPRPNPSNRIPFDNGEEDQQGKDKEDKEEEEDADKAPPIEVLPNALPSRPPADDNPELDTNELKSGMHTPAAALRSHSPSADSAPHCSSARLCIDCPPPNTVPIVPPCDTPPDNDGGKYDPSEDDESDGLDLDLDTLIKFDEEEEEEEGDGDKDNQEESDEDGENTAAIDPAGARNLGTHTSRHPGKPGQPARAPWKAQGERINMIQGCAIVHAEPEDTWSQEELDQLKIDWMVKETNKKAGTRKTNAEAAKDATLTGDRIFEEFLPDVLRMDTASFANKYSSRAHFNTDVEEAKLAKGPGKKNDVTSMLCEKHREITGKPTLDVEYVRYNKIMRAKEGVEIVGWPDMPMTAPSKMGVGGTAAIETLYERLKAGTCYWRRVNAQVCEELLAKYAGNVKKQVKRRKLAKGKGKEAAESEAEESEAEESEEEEEVPPPKKKKRVRVASDKEQEALPKKKAKAKKGKKRAVEEDKEEEEEDPKRKRKKAAAEAEDKEEDVPPKKKAKKKAPQGEEVETVENPKKKGKGKGFDKGKAKEKQITVKEPATEPKRSALKHRCSPARRSTSVVSSNADQSDADAAAPSTFISAATAAAASTSKSAANEHWDKIRVSEDIVAASKAAADRMKVMIAADRKAGTIAPPKPKLKAKTAKSLKEIEQDAYGSSVEE